MSGAGIVKLLSYFLEWLLSYYQDTVEGIITMLSSGQTDGALMWLMKSWKSLFIALIVCGIILNIVIFVARWKPYWWWFAKKRMIVDDALVEKRKKTSVHTNSSTAVKPSTYIPRRVNTSEHNRKAHRGGGNELTYEPDIMVTENDVLMTARKPKKASHK